jgi:hypothetical protein
VATRTFSDSVSCGKDFLAATQADSGWYEASRQRVGEETSGRVTCGPFGQSDRGAGSRHHRAGDIRGAEPNCVPLLPFSALRM